MPRLQIFEHPPFAGHELLDSGGGRKLERFGSRVLDRPDPQALWRPAAPERWAEADLRFVRESDRGGRWEPGRGRGAGRRGSGGARTGPGSEPGWTVGFGGATLRVRPTPFKHVGLFPEQAANWVWMADELARLGEHPRVLDLFGYTGAASVLAALAGAEVTHVDASKKTLAWLRENLVLSGLGEKAVRVVLDDALAFVRREARRGVRYDGILLDPPHFGRGPKGERWQFEDDAAGLVEVCAELLAERAFLVLSTYAIGFSPLSLLGLLGELEGGEVEAGELALPETAGGRLLPCGFCARWRR